MKLKFVKKDKRTLLEKEIEDVLRVMKKHDPSSKEYIIMSENLERLYKAGSHVRFRGITADTGALILANLFGLVLVLTYEKANVITSKAFNWILKGRV